jgi:pimeloyl-ACP methyl ester carboxylesterase
MAAIREARLELGGFETRALSVPAARGSSLPPLVFLHGFSDSADTWRPLMRLLAAEGRGALALDMPGFGRAGRLARDRPILPQLDGFAVAAIEHAAERSRTGRVVLAGNSLGGCVALRVAQRRGLPLDGAVPIAPAGLDMATWISVIEGAWAIQAILRSPFPLPEIAIRDLVGRTYRRLASARPRELEAEVVAAFTRSFASKRDVVRLLGTGRTLRSELREPFQLDWIDCPVLVIWGERDLMVHPSGGERIVGEVPGARLELLEDCGHCPQVECPGRLLELLGGFPLALAAAA